ncbi:MAG TPA: ATP-binding protein [Blastocatellia bacterium]|nr:ATP-binding protein [Blastocatellia bacterium]
MWKIKGPLVMLALILTIELVSNYVLVIVNPIPLYLAAVAFAAFSGGVRLVIAALVLMLLHAFYFYGAFGPSPGPSGRNLWPVVALAVTAPVVALVAGMIRRRIELLAREETKRIEAEAAQRRYRDLVQSLEAIVWEADAETWQFTFVSKRAEQILGYPVERWLSDPDFWVNIIHPEDRDFAVESCRASTEAGRNNDFEYRVISADGRVVWLHDMVEVVLGPSGKAKTLRGMMVDLTERKRAEDERSHLLFLEQAARADAEASQRRSAFLAEAGAVLAASLDYETTLRSMAFFAVPELADMCVIDLKDENGRARRVAVAHVNPAKEELLKEAQRLYPPDISANTKMAYALRSGRPELIREVTDEVLVAYSRDAEHLRMMRELNIKSMMAVPLILRGHTLGAVGLMLSESDRRYVPADLVLAEELARRAALAIDNARLYREAQEANRAKDEFLATVSHELRTPLNAILGWSHILLESRIDEATRARALETIERNARAQAQLIDDILDVSRIITGRLRLDVRPVEMVSVVSAAVDSVRPAAKARGIDVRMSLEPTVECVSGDSNRLQQVLWNLLSNAIKFTPSGGRVDVRLESAGAQGFASEAEGHVSARGGNPPDGNQPAVPCARITVSDTGQGINPEFLPYVFDRFRQADSSTTRRHGGLGLGLAIVRHLVEMHGGTISVQSAGEGQGATFTVDLPLAQSQRSRRSAFADSGPQRQAAVPAGAGQGSISGKLRGVSILIVDDDPDTLDMLVNLFMRTGAEVRRAASAREAMEVLAGWSPGVIVSDVAMPDQDGYELIRKIRALKPEQGGDIPAVALTAYATAEDRARALSSGFQMHVAKPVEPTEIVSIVAKLALRARGV